MQVLVGWQLHRPSRPPGYPSAGFCQAGGSCGMGASCEQRPSGYKRTTIDIGPPDDPRSREQLTSVDGTCASGTSRIVARGLVGDVWRCRRGAWVTTGLPSGQFGLDRGGVDRWDVPLRDPADDCSIRARGYSGDLWPRLGICVSGLTWGFLEPPVVSNPSPTARVTMSASPLINVDSQDLRPRSTIGVMQIIPRGGFAAIALGNSQGTPAVRRRARPRELLQ